MKWAPREGDSGRPARGEIDKAFVIQTFSAGLRNRTSRPKFFQNIFLDSALPPERSAPPVEDGDNHPQPFENKEEYMPRAAIDLSG
jgi:hypothetical protein